MCAMNRYSGISNIYKTELPSSQLGDTSITHLDILLPRFTTLKSFTVKRIGGEGPGVVSYISALRQVMRTCLSLTDLIVELRYGIEDLADMSSLEKQIASEPTVRQPNLQNLAIRLGQMQYNGNLAPTFSILNLICRIVGSSSRTVRSFKFGVGVHDLHEDFDETIYRKSEWHMIPRDQGKPMLNLPQIEKLQLDFTETVLTRKLFSEFCYANRNNVRELSLWYMVHMEPYKIDDVCIIFPSQVYPQPQNFGALRETLELLREDVDALYLCLKLTLF
ncbi:hypothetical protein TWF718_007273 [Orbilia javanica]|uniref:Uncharacterized protein n=1 Tax=Orbilia javanica TaxID=47235 RepID=A0AAN8RIA9_9PEZI